MENSSCIRPYRFFIQLMRTYGTQWKPTIPTSGICHVINVEISNDLN